MRRNHCRCAFTIIELLVVVSIIALLIGILLPAIGKAREQANLTKSQANLRNIAIAHQTYGAEFADRQLTLMPDDIATYGDDPGSALAAYSSVNGSTNANPILGQNADGTFWFYAPSSVVGVPYNWEADYGVFRVINCGQFNQYLGGQFIDPVFYAPKDRVVTEWVDFDSPGEWEIPPGGATLQHSSYILSPAAMFNPLVFGKGGFIDPWTIAGGLRCPSFSDALFPELKTHMLEHHWLQNAQLDCNGAFSGGYDGCEPYYFNHAQRSQPVALFYDGHIQTVGVTQAEQASTRSQAQSGFALWRDDTPNGTDGYFQDVGYDFSSTSFHIFTTDGIRGRDVLK